jgi:hypothetical protein
MNVAESLNFPEQNVVLSEILSSTFFVAERNLSYPFL